MPQKELIFTIIMPLKNKTKKEKKPTKIGLFLLSFNYCAFRISYLSGFLAYFVIQHYFPWKSKKKKFLLNLLGFSILYISFLWQIYE